MPLLPRSSARVRAVALVLGPSLAVTAGLGLLVASPATAATGPVALDSAADFAVLAASTVTNTGPSVLTGDLGLSPGTSVTGFPPGIVNGTTHVADAVATEAQTDATAAYVDAAGRPAERTLSPDPTGQVLTPGVYDGGSLLLTGTVTLDAGGDPNAVFLLRVTSTLDTAAGSTVALVNGAQACNVFWTVGSSATLGADSDFAGTVLAVASVSTGSGADVSGRLLARTGAVTLIATDVTRPVCAAAAPSPTASTTAPTPAAEPTASAAPTAPATPSPTPVVASEGPFPTDTPLSPVPATDGGGGSGDGGSSTGGDVPQLPRTGQHSDELLLLGVLAVLIGGVMTAAGRTPYAPRHARSRSPQLL